MKKRAIDLTPGDLVDLEGDQFADPEKDHPLYQYEFQEVMDVDVETSECVCIYFTGVTCGFPHNHELEILS